MTTLKTGIKVVFLGALFGANVWGAEVVPTSLTVSLTREEEAAVAAFQLAEKEQAALPDISLTSEDEGEKSTSKGKKKNYLMAALGDSITAAFLADTSLANYNKPLPTAPTDQSIDLEVESFGLTTLLTPIIHFLENRNTLSWATGRKISSHYRLLKMYLEKNEGKVDMTSLNVAKSGGTTYDLINEADKLVGTVNSKKYDGVKLIDLLIGANDSCKQPVVTDDEMKDNLRQVFDKLAEIHQTEPIRILMSAMPRIPDLGREDINESKTIFGLTCHAMRNHVTKSCLPVVTWSTEEEFNERMDFISQRNQLLQEAAFEAQQRHPQLQIAFSVKVFNKVLEPLDLAIDCFHPNQRSQQELSQDTWMDQPWYQ